MAATARRQRPANSPNLREKGGNSGRHAASARVGSGSPPSGGVCSSQIGVVASSCKRVLSPHMLRVLCLLFVLSNAIAFAPTPARLARPHLAPTPQTARIRPRIEGTRMRVEGGHACGLRQRLQLAMIVVVSPMICYPAVAVASPVASEQRREAVIGIIEVAAPLAVAVGLCVPTTEPPGPSQSSARSSRRRSPGETLQPAAAVDREILYMESAQKWRHVEKYVWCGWGDTLRHVSLHVSQLN